MDKNTVLIWLEKCGGEDHDEICEECPFVNCEDCAGALMTEAARVLKESGGCDNG